MSKESIKENSAMSKLIDFLETSGIPHGVHHNSCKQKELHNCENSTLYSNTDDSVHEVSYNSNHEKDGNYIEDKSCCAIVRFDSEGNFIENLLYEM
jgi:hypothetical protein